MKVKKFDKMWQYVALTYLLFWFLVLGVGGTAIFVFDASQNVMRLITTICSWAPTIILLIMLKKLKPGLTIKAFYNKAFAVRLNPKVFSAAVLLIVGIFMISVWILSLYEKTAFSAQLNFAVTLLAGNILFTAIQGASGEESGWRGYLMPELEGRHGFVKGNLILGLVWAFWHLPLWFVSTGYTGAELLLYVVSFIIGLTSFSMIVGVFMKKCNNLIFAFWMHFLFNFVLTFFIGSDLHLLTVYALLYGLAAVVIVIGYQKKVQRNGNIYKSNVSIVP